MGGRDRTVQRWLRCLLSDETKKHAALELLCMLVNVTLVFLK